MKIKNSIILWCLTGSLAFTARAQSTAPDLTELSLDQLSNIKITSFTKKQQKLSQVAGAVYVITQEQISRSGLTSVPDLLRLCPGVEVDRLNSSQWSVSVRGFAGAFANKLLVLIDGRSIYSPMFSGVYWEMGMPLLDDIDRIEVIRGPGATIWGANAVLGVVNIITKTTQETKGTVISAAVGSSERAFGGVHVGGNLGTTSYRLGFAGYNHAQFANASGAGAADSWSSLQGEFRLDGSSPDKHDTWMLEGNVFRGIENQNAVNPSVLAQSFVESPTHFDTTAASLTGEWRKKVGDTAEFRVQSYFDLVNHPEQQASRVESRTGDVELQYDFVAGHIHNFSIGLGDRLINLGAQTTGVYTFHESGLIYNNANGFAQDEIHFLDDRLLLTLGAKLEHNRFGGWAGEPSANLVWIPNKHHSLWTSVARAVRTPTLFETLVDAPISIAPASALTGGLPVLATVSGSTSFGNELVNDFEVGYRAELSKKLSLDVDLFYDRFSKLRAFEPTDTSFVPGVPPYLLASYSFLNGYEGSGKGTETAINWQAFHSWKLAASYTYNFLRTNVSPDAPPGTADGSGLSPARDKVKIQSYWNISKALDFDTFLYWSSTEQDSFTYTNLPIPAYWRLDVRVGYKINPHWQVSVAGQNLLQSRHFEGAPELLTTYSYVPRGAYLQSTWRF